MKVEYLQYIIEVEKKGSISKAAQALFLSQPYLSKIIREMEEELNITIFERTNNGVILTEQGEDFLQHSKKIIKDLENFMKFYRDSQHKTCFFRISTIYSSHVMDIFLRLNNEYKNESNMRFYIKETNNYTVVNDIYSKTSDIGVVYVGESIKRTFLNMFKMKNIDHTFISKSDVKVILSKNHPLLKNGRKICSEELYKYGMVRYADYMGFGMESVDYISLYNLKDADKINKFIYVDDRAGLHNALTQTDYFTIGIKDVINQEEVHNLVSITLEDDNILHNEIIEMWVINLKDKGLSEIEKNFIRILKENYGE